MLWRDYAKRFAATRRRRFSPQMPLQSPLQPGNEKTALTVWGFKQRVLAAALVGQQNQFVNMRKVLGVQSVEM